MSATVVNSHVTRLGRYLTFEPGHDQIYEERADPEQLKSIETVAARTLKALVESGDTRLIVLTGDAGHGKTHLCRLALENALGLDAKEAHDRLMASGEGDVAVATIAGRELYVIRDLSELRVSAAKMLCEAVSGTNRITLVCANEGKLRAVIAEARDKLDVIRRTLEQTQRTGHISVEPGIVVLDLNHQSVTSATGQSFVSGLLGQWALDGRRWSTCGKCPAQDHCPILANRRLLAGEDDENLGRTRREGLSLVLRVAEQAGTVITIRESLILLAFAITGGLNCQKVHSGSYDTNPNSFHRRLFYQVLFEPPLTPDQRATLPLLQTLAKLDPGRNAIRSVDEALISSARDTNESAVQSAAKPTTRGQMKTEAKRHRDAVASMRRRDFFDLQTDREWRAMKGEAAPIVARAERLGFRHHHQFDTVVGSPSNLESIRPVRDVLLKGLEAVQDVRRGVQTLTNFAVVDPAYAVASGTASILALEVLAKHVRAMSQREYWKLTSSGESRLPESVDWIDRQVSVVFFPDTDESVALHLNLLQFEFVLRSAGGLASRRFFQGDIRRITSRLDRLADRAKGSGRDSIKVIYGDRVMDIMIEDGRIVCGSGS